MPIELSGKPILITGASSGIGEATALECARAGMPVVVAARRANRLEGLVSRIRSAGGNSLAVPLDVQDVQACAAAIETCKREFGSVYSVFANAGYGAEVPAHEMSDAQVREMFETNFYGSLNVIRPALPHMLEAGHGHVLICSSCLARCPIPLMSIYGATKAAQHHLAWAMRIELGPSGVHVSSVLPVGTRTEFFEQAAAASSQPGTGAAKPMALDPHMPKWMLQSPVKVARAVVRCLRRPKPEVWTSPTTRWSMAIAAAFPSLADMGMRSMFRKRMSAPDGAAHGG